ncbi:ATPase inhibitor mai-2, mitochondrial-like isoform X1 [Mercenaria mercenaria]|uniref:ATPase inhibitor mai-2, mitochondrial-like isoform X1 n=1 Tax=Mercenaria mercenaria TaxID=6596 RepID=UPI00234E884A|nr:ATPase inhibitor mai-2, mitochondrial-like isoform X1 [Mercenaria mercenaria]
MALRLAPNLLRSLRLTSVRAMSQVGGFGEGAGKGGGAGGSIRDAGGSFGKMEAAHEEEYFRKLNAAHMEEIKKHHKEEMEAHIRDNIEHLEANVKSAEEAIKRHKKRLAELRKDDSDSD